MKSVNYALSTSQVTRSLLISTTLPLALAIGILIAWRTEWFWWLLGLTGAFLLVLAILKSPRLGLYLLVAFIPLQGVAEVDSFVTVARGLGAVLAVAWLFHLAHGHILWPRLQSSPILVGIILFVGYSLLSSLWAVDKVSALWETFQYFGLSVFVFITVSLIREPIHWRDLAIAVVGGDIVASAYGLWLFSAFGPTYRLGLYGLGNPNWMALAFVCGVPFIFLGVALSTSRLATVLWSISLVVLVLAVIGTASLSGFGAMLIALVLCVRYSGATRNKYRWVVILTVALALVALFVLPPSLGNPLLLKRLAIFRREGLGAIDRLEMWRVGVEVFLQRPILGHGAGQGRAAIGDLSPFLKEQSARANRLPTVHNIVLAIADDFGVVGSVILLGVLIPALRKSLSWLRLGRTMKNNDMFPICYFAGSLPLIVLIIGFFQPVETHKLLWLAIGCVVAAENLASVNSGRTKGA